MVKINVSDYIKHLGSKTKFEAKSFEDTKKDLEELSEYDILFEGLESSLFRPEISRYMQDHDSKTKALISKIKEKKEITGRLDSLSYSVRWLKSGVIIDDDTIINKAIESIMKNEHSSINSIVLELNSFKNKIEEFENLHISLLKSGLSLDIKTLLEQDFRRKHRKLNELHNQQKNILLSLSNIFVELTKDYVSKKNR